MQPILGYDDVLGVMEVGIQAFQVKTDRQTDAFFSAIDHFWRTAVERPVFCVIDYTHFALALSQKARWCAKIRQAVTTYSYSTIRYGTPTISEPLETLIADAGVPPNVYAGREQAFRAIQGDLLAHRAPELLWSGKLAPLSPRERTVASYAARGFQNTQIAANLGTSPHTVRHQLEAVFQKCRVFSRAELGWLLNSELRQREALLRDALETRIRLGNPKQ